MEVDAVVAEFHARLPRNLATAIGSIYARYSTSDQDSVADQVRAMLTRAEAEGIFVPRELIFFDLAVRGFKHQRKGLEELREALRNRQATVALFLATNRVYRKVYRSLELVDVLVKEYGVRCIFAANRIDTADRDRWQPLLHFNTMLDEYGATANAENVRVAHLGLLANRRVFGALPFGFRSDPIPGELTRRKRPAGQIAIEEEAACFVRLVFRWFALDGLSLQSIVRRLNSDAEIPISDRSQADEWTRCAVHRMLSNPRYRGEWPYGAEERVFLPSKDYTRQLKRSQPLGCNYFEDLRIVPDELWHAAQKRLAEHREKGGRRPKDGKRRQRPRLLNGLFWCPAHDRPLIVGGAFGGSMFCKVCQRADKASRPIYTLLNRQVALASTCEVIAKLIRDDENLVSEIVEAVRVAASKIHDVDDTQVESLRRRLAEVCRRIDFVLRTPGHSQEDEAECRAAVTRHRQERNSLSAEIATLEAQKARPIRVPTAEEVSVLLADASAILQAANNGTDEECAKARQVIELITGGRIDLVQMGPREPKKGWLQGRFRPRILHLALAKLNVHISAEQDGPEIAIDYRLYATHPLQERVVELAQAGWLFKDIAAEIGRQPSVITKLLKRAGFSSEDGRRRRAALPRKQRTEPTYRRIAGDVTPLWLAGHSNLELGRRFNCSDQTVKDAVRHYHRERQLPVPSRRQRDGLIAMHAEALYQSGGMRLKDVAVQIGRSDVWVRQQLRRLAEARGERLQDGRSARHGRTGTAE